LHDAAPTSPSLSPAFAVPAAYGDLVAAILANGLHVMPSIGEIRLLA